MKLKITQTRSLIHSSGRQRRTMQALGLRRIRHTVQHDDTPVIRGMRTSVQDILANLGQIISLEMLAAALKIRFKGKVLANSLELIQKVTTFRPSTFAR